MEDTKSFKYRQWLVENSLLTCSDEALDTLFLHLEDLPSPQKEEAFVHFCLFGTPSSEVEVIH